MKPKSDPRLIAINNQNRMFSETKITNIDMQHFNAKYNPAERAAMIISLIETDTLGFKSILDKSGKLDQDKVQYIREKEIMNERREWKKPPPFDTAFIMGVAIAREMLAAKEMIESQHDGIRPVKSY